MWWHIDCKFIYFFVAALIVNNSEGGKFRGTPYLTDQISKDTWATNGGSRVLSPEILTYWSKEE